MVLSPSVPDTARWRVAAILDEFSLASFGPEADIISLHAHTWRSQCEAALPDLLLVESAWFGEQRSWFREVSEARHNLRELLAWCRERNIPSVFWNKEDPVHFERFLKSASLFDIVLSTDVDCVPRYQQQLGHMRVHALPFACQPRAYHPMVQAPRLERACFAGAYYHRFPERIHDFHELFAGVSACVPVDIYDRYFGSVDSNYRFPETYRAAVRGSLPASEVPDLYRRYQFGLNLNSVKSSPTMFARRVFELLGTGNVVISNSSTGVQTLFGDIVISADKAEEISASVSKLVEAPQLMTQRIVRGVRSIMRHHTYANRLETIATYAFPGQVSKLRPPHILLMTAPNTLAEARQIISCALAQCYSSWKMLLLAPDNLLAELSSNINSSQIAVLPLAEVKHTSLEDLAARAAELNECELLWFGAWKTEDYYGPQFLADLVDGMQFCDSQAIGQAAYWALTADGVRIEGEPSSYRAGEALPARASLVRLPIVGHLSASALIDTLPNMYYRGSTTVSVAASDYCRGGGTNAQTVAPIVDIAALAMPQWEAILPAPVRPAGHFKTAGMPPFLSSVELEEVFGDLKAHALQAELDQFGWHIISELPDTQATTVWSDRRILPASVRAIGVWRFHVSATGSLPLHLAIRSFGANGEILRDYEFECNENAQCDLPFGTRLLSLGWRITGSGSARVHGIALGWTTPGAKVTNR